MSVQQCYRSLLLDRTCNHSSETRFPVVSRTVEEVTSEPVIAENREPPKTPADTQHVEGKHQDVVLVLEDNM